ncbi:MAG: hypothetical protein M1829_005458 [Trizodia sp. TS-e1964]|nr:MAG: hypothetical protein M1829_005458 [Trizodia sp. TS-e1964]
MASDDDFLDDDEIPIDTLIELEERAIQSTQNPIQIAVDPVSQSNIKKQIYESTIAINPTSSDYGDLSSQEWPTQLDPTVPFEIVTEERPVFKGNSYQNHSQEGLHHHIRLQQSFHCQAGHDQNDNNDDDREMADNAMPVDPANPELSELQITVEQLRKEKEALEETLKQTKLEVQTKTGEISVVRGKLTRAENETLRQAIALENLLSDQAAQKDEELKSTKLLLQNQTTEIVFLRKELEDEAKRVRALQKANDEGGAAPIQTRKPSTPKKALSIQNGDGFDEDEILVSPSARRGKLNFGTPKGANKRKRALFEKSPIKSLPLSQPVVQDPPKNVEHEQPNIFNESLLKLLGKENDKFHFFQTMLEHRSSEMKVRTIEALAKFSLPSTPEKTISTLIFDSVLTHSMGADSETFELGFCKILLSVWTVCLEECYYSPLYLIIKLLSFALALDTATLAPPLTKDIVRLSQSTADINVIARFKREPINSEVELTTECMSILLLTGQGCFKSDAFTREFWRELRYDFVLMLLSQEQLLEDISAMVKMLTTSVRKDSFGAIIAAEDGNQKTVEKQAVGRISLLLGDCLSEKHERSAIFDLKIDVLHLLGAICSRKYGCQLLSNHETTIGFVITLMTDEMDNLYNFPGSSQQSATIISISIRLLHYLASTFADKAPFVRKVHSVTGGSHKFVTTLSKLSFSDGIVFEADIEQVVIDCARELLGDFVTPEEADEISSAFAGLGASTER